MPKIVVYRIVGKQLFFRVPRKFCEECDLSIAVAKSVQQKMKKKGIKIDLEVKPWINYFIPAILKGVWHPPGVLIDGKLISQGKVPIAKDIEEAINNILNKA